MQGYTQKRVFVPECRTHPQEHGRYVKDDKAHHWSFVVPVKLGRLCE